MLIDARQVNRRPWCERKNVIERFSEFVLETVQRLADIVSPRILEAFAQAPFLPLGKIKLVRVLLKNNTADDNKLLYMFGTNNNASSINRSL